MFVCVCKAVSDRDLAKAIADGAETVEDVAQRTGAGTGCGRCVHAIEQTLDMANGRSPRVRLRILAAIVS